MNILPAHVHFLDADEPEGDEAGVYVQVITSTGFLVVGPNRCDRIPEALPSPFSSEAFVRALPSARHLRMRIWGLRSPGMASVFRCGRPGAGGISAVHRLLLV
jgi:hypothetical protein